MKTWSLVAIVFAVSAAAVTCGDVGSAGRVEMGADEAGRIVLLDGNSAALADLRPRIEEIMQEARLPGLQIAVLAGGELVDAMGFGVRDTKSGEPVTNRTVFAANSFSKTLFAYLVLQLVDEGVLDLDTPMVTYLRQPIGDYEFYADLADDARAALLTPRMALSHTTGFPNWRWFTPEGTLHFIYEPGQRHGYSGEGILLLQLVVEEVTGTGLESLARTRIFDPLGMARTSFVSLPAFEDDLAEDHDHYLNPIAKERRDEANAAGSAQTTAEDYARFLRAVMTGQGLSSQTRVSMFEPEVTIEHARMFGPLSQVASSPTSVTSWGLGWGLVESDHGRAFFHTGNDRGAANYHIGFPELGIAVVLHGNSQTLETAAPELTRLIIGDAASPFEFLGYEPIGSARHALVDEIAEAGWEAGLARLEATDPRDIQRWHPSKWAVIDAAGQDLIGLGHLDEAIDLYRHFVATYADREFGADRLASVLVRREHLAEAREVFERGLARVSGDPFWTRLYEWKLAWVGALVTPQRVDVERLRGYAGVYGPRHVELRNGELFYYREGTPDPTARRLYALTEDTFVLRSNDDFRMRFERGEDGVVTGITGLYLDGDPDQTPRNPS